MRLVYPLIFAIGLVWFLTKAMKEAVYAAMAAAYLYFGIPHYEWGAPQAPYQAAFWALGVLLAARYTGQAVDWAREDLRKAAAKGFDALVENTLPAMKTAMFEAAMAGVQQGQIAAKGVEAGANACEGLEERVPFGILDDVKEAVERAVKAGGEVGEKECLRVMEGAGGQPHDQLLKSMDRRVTPFVTEGMRKAFDGIFEKKMEAMLEKSAEGQEGMYPLVKSPWAAIATNAGLWLFLLWWAQSWIMAQGDLPRPGSAAAKLSVQKLLLLPMFSIMASVRTEQHWRLFCFAWMAGVWHLSGRAGKLWITYGGRIDDVGGQGGEANFLGAIIVCVAPIAISMFMMEPTKKMRRVGLVSSGIYVLGILACGSRGALCAFVGSMGYWLMQTAKKGKAFAFAMFGVSAFLAVAPPDFYARMATIIGPPDNGFVKAKEDESKRERQELWKLAIEVWEDNPVFGVGPNQYPHYSAQALPEMVGAYSGQPGLMTHNSWLQILSEFGSFGMFCWGGAFFLSFFCFKKARKVVKDHEGTQWFQGMCLGWEAGTLGSALAITFSSFQWLDYIYWHMVFGPLTLQVAKDWKKRLDYLRPATEAVDEEGKPLLDSGPGGRGPRGPAGQGRPGRRPGPGAPGAAAGRPQAGQPTPGQRGGAPPRPGQPAAPRQGPGGGAGGGGGWGR